MANKQNVFNAFYEGVCLILSELAGTTGMNIQELSVDIDELRSFAEANGYQLVLDLIGDTS